MSLVTQGGASLVSSGSVNQVNGAASYASLRSLGAKSTLVLLNGQRVAGYAFSQLRNVVDLNTIPTAALDRIEVLSDGASSIYGTDAIAGVVNIILRKDYKGVEVGAQVASSKARTTTAPTSPWASATSVRRKNSTSLACSTTTSATSSAMRTRSSAVARQARHGGGRNHQSFTGGGTWRQHTPAGALTPVHRAISE